MKKLMPIKNKIKSYRKELKLTQQELGECVGVSTSAIKDIENHRIGASRKTAIALKKRLKTRSINKLFYLDEEDYLS